jgi:hypothetical protein
MSRFTIPRRLWLTLFWGAAITLVLAARYEMEYRDQVRNLPRLVDAQGRTASPEVAMAGLDSYLKAKQLRKYGLYSLCVGVVLCAGIAATKQSDARVHGG